MVERLTAWFHQPFISKEHSKVVTARVLWAGMSKSQSPRAASSGAQASSNSFHAAAWLQAPFLEWTHASICPWTQGALNIRLLRKHTLRNLCQWQSWEWSPGLSIPVFLPATSYSSNTSLPANFAIYGSLEKQRKSSLDKPYTTWKSTQ